MQLFHATVSKAPRQVSTKYGERVVCDVLLPDGSESAVWGPVGYAPLEYLERGQAVTVGRDSKGKISIVENHPMYPESEKPIPQLPQAAPTETQTAGNKHALSPETKREIADYVTQQKDLLSYCWQQAATIPGVSEEQTLEKLAVTLYLSAQRRFGLA